MTAVYDVLGVRVGIEADASAIALIDRSYGGFRASDRGPTRWLSMSGVRSGTETLRTIEGDDGLSSALDLLHELVVVIMAGLLERGLYAVHAGAVACGDAALMLAGPGGAGKTTLTLALVARGFDVLSDELAVIDPESQTILPYRRNVHVRPGTPELVAGLGPLVDRPRERLGGGIAWAVPQADLGAGVDDVAPRRLAGVILLQPRDPSLHAPSIAPVRSSLAAMELLRGTWAASVDYVGSMGAMARAIRDVPCVRLASADPMPSADLVATWFGDR